MVFLNPKHNFGKKSGGVGGHRVNWEKWSLDGVICNHIDFAWS